MRIWFEPTFVERIVEEMRSNHLNLHYASR
jgi:hypothetical protein